MSPADSAPGPESSPARKTRRTSPETAVSAGYRPACAQGSATGTGQTATAPPGEFRMYESRRCSCGLLDSLFVVVYERHERSFEVGAGDLKHFEVGIGRQPIPQCRCRIAAHDLNVVFESIDRGDRLQCADRVQAGRRPRPDQAAGHMA